MKIYTFNGKTFNKLPGMLKTDSGTVSPVTEELFLQLGGVIGDDGEPTPEEKFFSDLNAYLVGLELRCEQLALDISIDEFKEAAATMMSGELIDWAREKGVPEEMIAEVRNDILTMIADASRIGMSWNDIFPKEN